MNILDVIENIEETELSESEVKNNSFYKKCFGLKSPMQFTDKIGTIEDIDELIAFLENSLIHKANVKRIQETIFSLRPEKSTNLNFV